MPHIKCQVLEEAGAMEKPPPVLQASKLCYNPGTAQVHQGLSWSYKTSLPLLCPTPLSCMSMSLQGRRHDVRQRRKSCTTRRAGGLMKAPRGGQQTTDMKGP